MKTYLFANLTIVLEIKQITNPFEYAFPSYGERLEMAIVNDGTKLGLD